MRRTLQSLAVLVAAALSPTACNNAASNGGDDAGVPPICGVGGITLDSRFPEGDPVGARDLFMARAKGQARAGRVDDPAQIVIRPDARQKVRTGDFLILNDKIAAYIEAPGISDGYFEFGGEILALDRVGDDGRPIAKSTFGETMLFISKQGLKAEKITVINDGTDGKAAVLRVSGRLADIPFLQTFEVLFRDSYDVPAAIDYVLEPGAEVLKLRLSLMNATETDLELADKRNAGFFQSSRQRMFAPGTGFDLPSGKIDLLGFDGGDVAFAFRVPGQKLSFVTTISGFAYATVTGPTVETCGTKTIDLAEYAVGGPEIDGALAALRRTDNAGKDPWRVVSGRVLVGADPVPGAKVHARRAGGEYLTRVTADSMGRYSIHVPSGADVELIPTSLGNPIPAATKLAADQMTADLVFAANGIIQVTARDEGSNAALPVRVQVVPKDTPAATPLAFGIDDPLRGRLHQAFAVDGKATLVVPPGEHRVIVSRGFEWEILDRTVTVAAGQTVPVDAVLRHSVDSTGIMCSDFHIHSHYSADSSDDVEYKVKGAIADGLEIPVSSEHEWIIDFQPIIEKFGLTRWAFGFPSEEFTTFTWGHFGIIPIKPRPEAVNNGGIPWIGRTPPEVFHDIANLPEKPVLIVNHPSGGGFMAYFSSVHFNRTTASGDPDRWSEEFGAIEVFNASDLEGNRAKSVADWFALLNAGKVRWAVGNSDSHSLRSSPVGYPRTCFRFGHDDPTKLTAEAVRDELARGNAVVSGGLLIDVRGPNGEGPGQTIKGAGAKVGFDIVVQSPGWLEAKQIEVIVDGETVDVQSLRPVMTQTGAHRYENHLEVTPPKNAKATHWVVFHANNPGATLAPVLEGKNPFAVSNPIFF
mgnify:CR=1 FL=1